MSLIQFGDRVVHVCGGGTSAPIPHRRKKLFWCFQCRKRHLHTLMLTTFHSEWYEPMAWWQCPQCGEDRRLFPGWEYVE